jgi:hypothetical protein
MGNVQKHNTCILFYIFILNWLNERRKISSSNGFTAWRTLNPRIQDYESGHAYRSEFVAWKEVERALNKSGLIGDNIQ